MKNIKNYLFVLLFSVIALLGPVALFFGMGTGKVWAIVLGIIAFPFGIVFAMMFLHKARATCSKCGQSLKGGQWGYDTVSSETQVTSNGTATQVYKFEIEVICPHCGETKTFHTTFRGKPNENMKFKIDKYMKELYGQK